MQFNINTLCFLQNDMTTVSLQWEEILMPLLQKYKLNMTWGDQDLLNIIFYHNPGVSTHIRCITLNQNVLYGTNGAGHINKYLLLKGSYIISSVIYHKFLPNYVSLCFTESLYVFPCQWNYRPDHCIYGSNCREAEHEGVFILHGNRGVFHDDKQPAFRAVYEAFQKVEAVPFFT